MFRFSYISNRFYLSLLGCIISTMNKYFFQIVIGFCFLLLLLHYINKKFSIQFFQFYCLFSSFFIYFIFSSFLLIIYMINFFVNFSSEFYPLSSRLNYLLGILLQIILYMLLFICAFNFLFQ